MLFGFHLKDLFAVTCELRVLPRRHSLPPPPYPPSLSVKRMQWAQSCSGLEEIPQPTGDASRRIKETDATTSCTAPCCAPALYLPPPRDLVTPILDLAGTK